MGMNVGRVIGTALSDAQIEDILDGKKILLEGLKGKSGILYKFSMEFPKKKFSGKKK